CAPGGEPVHYRGELHSRRDRLAAAPVERPCESSALSMPVTWPVSAGEQSTPVGRGAVPGGHRHPALALGPTEAACCGSPTSGRTGLHHRVEERLIWSPASRVGRHEIARTSTRCAIYRQMRKERTPKTMSVK